MLSGDRDGGLILRLLMGFTGVDGGIVFVVAFVDSLFLVLSASELGPHVAPEPAVLRTALAEKKVLFFVGHVLLNLFKGAVAIALSGLEFKVGLAKGFLFKGF